MIKLSLLAAGYCTHPEYIVMRGGRRNSVPFPAMFALLEHPTRGPILFDTGYTARFYEETRRFPASLYAKITPVYFDEAQSARHQLEARGIKQEAIQYVLISHFHADHIGGVADFPQACYLYFREAYEAVREQRGFRAVRAGFLPGLLPNDFEQRSAPVDIADISPLPADYAPFTHGVDLFGDQSLLAVALPGHAQGQMGLFLQTDAGETVFLAADACWHSKAYRELIWPHPLANLIQADAQAYRETLGKLHKLHVDQPHIRIVPFHCQEIYAQLNENSPPTPTLRCAPDSSSLNLGEEAGG